MVAASHLLFAANYQASGARPPSGTLRLALRHPAVTCPRVIGYRDEAGRMGPKAPTRHAQMDGSERQEQVQDRRKQVAPRPFAG